MGYDEAFRSVIVSQDSYISLESNHLVLRSRAHGNGTNGSRACSEGVQKDLVSKAEAQNNEPQDNKSQGGDSEIQSPSIQNTAMSDDAVQSDSAQKGKIDSHNTIEARIFLKDIHTIILESRQTTITSALLSALAKHNIILLTCDETHHINGIFHGFLGHFQHAKIAREQIAISHQKKAVLWQKIIKNKITNQASLLQIMGKKTESARLNELAKCVELGDSTNMEAAAASIYFKALFGRGFSRNDASFANSALDYGYAIVRACVVRHVCMSGLLTWLGIKHDNMFNNFNLCDDLIEVFRPCVDLCVLSLKEGETQEWLSREHKKSLIAVLQAEVAIEGQSYPLNRAIARYVQSFRGALLYGEKFLSVALSRGES